MKIHKQHTFRIDEPPGIQTRCGRLLRNGETKIIDAWEHVDCKMCLYLRKAEFTRSYLNILATAEERE